MKQKTQKINRNTKLGGLLKIKGADKILLKYGVPCLSCPMASLEINKLEIGQVCQMYGLPLEKILKELKGE